MKPKGTLTKGLKWTKVEGVILWRAKDIFEADFKVDGTRGWGFSEFLTSWSYFIAKRMRTSPEAPEKYMLGVSAGKANWHIYCKRVSEAKYIAEVLRSRLRKAFGAKGRQTVVE